uniref:U60-Liphistoxin-Lsp1a_1 n=1 Tax=Liphistius sp. SGP-2016 TaxID=1905180 RepID=A0A4Q8K0W8_9ARAC
MKLAICSLVILSVAVAIEAYGWRGGCKSQDDCPEDECCMGFSNFYGSCRKRLAKGYNCQPNLKRGEKFYFGQCPCQVGLECTMRDDYDFPGSQYVKDARCRQPPAEAPIAESSEAPVIPEE